MSFQLQKLLPRHYQIIDLFLDGNLTIKQIAEKVSMTVPGISNIRNSPTFQHELTLRKTQRDKTYDELASREKADDLSIRMRTDDLIRQSTEDAANTIIKLLDSEDESVQLRSASDLLDRGGFPKAQKLEQDIKTAVVVLSPSDVQRIEKTLKLEDTADTQDREKDGVFCPDSGSVLEPNNLEPAGKTPPSLFDMQDENDTVKTPGGQ